MFNPIKSRRSRSLQQSEKLLSVAGHLFWQKGYLGTSIDEIANAANVNKAIIYYYFRNKSAILFELASKSMQAMIDKALPIVNSNMPPEEKLKAFITQHIMFALTHLQLAGIGHVERKNLPGKLQRIYINMRDEYERNFRRILEEGIKQGKFRPVNVKITSIFILGLLNSIAQWFKPKEKLLAEEIASEAYLFISNTIILEAAPIALTSTLLTEHGEMLEIDPYSLPQNDQSRSDPLTDQDKGINNS